MLCFKEGVQPHLLRQWCGKITTQSRCWYTWGCCDSLSSVSSLNVSLPGVSASCKQPLAL